MKMIAAFAFIGTILQFLCVLLNFLIVSFGVAFDDMPEFLFRTIEALQIVGIGMVCVFFYAIWKGQKK